MERTQKRAGQVAAHAADTIDDVVALPFLAGLPEEFREEEEARLERVGHEESYASMLQQQVLTLQNEFLKEYVRAKTGGKLKERVNIIFPRENEHESHYEREARVSADADGFKVKIQMSESDEESIIIKGDMENGKLSVTYWGTQHPMATFFAGMVGALPGVALNLLHAGLDITLATIGVGACVGAYLPTYFSRRNATALEDVPATKDPEQTVDSVRLFAAALECLRIARLERDSQYRPQCAVKDAGEFQEQYRKHLAEAQKKLATLVKKEDE